MTAPGTIDVSMMIVAIVLVLVIFILSLVQTRRGKRPIGVIPIILLILGLLFVVFLTYRARELEAASWAEILLLIGLVTITAVYANASVKMAKEMREQRYDAVRPVIDIQAVLKLDAAISAGLAAEREDFSWGLSCMLHNIGLGPAIDVYSFIQVQKNEHRCWDFGTLAKDQKTDNPKSLSINKKGDRNYMAVYYKDVFGRNFESSREVKPTKEKTALEIGPLKTVLVKESKTK